IYGTRTQLPDGRDSRTYLGHLHELETEARAAKRRAWGKAHGRLGSLLSLPCGEQKRQNPIARSTGNNRPTRCPLRLGKRSSWRSPMCCLSTSLVIQNFRLTTSTRRLRN